MGFFSSKSSSKSTTKYNPGEWQKQGMEYFSDLLKQGTPEYPTMDIAGLTPFQQAIQGYLQSSVQAGQQNYGLASEQMRGTLQGNYDPMTSPYFQGFRQLAEEQKAESANAVRQRSQMAGMLNSSPSIGMETDSNRQYDSTILNELGRLQNAERERQMYAAQALPQMDRQNQGNLAAASALGEAPRMIEQQRNEQQYQQALNQMLFPYTVQTNYANALINSNWGASISSKSSSSSTPSTWGAISSVGGAVLGGMGAMQGMNTMRAQANMYNSMAGFYSSPSMGQPGITNTK